MVPHSTSQAHSSRINSLRARSLSQRGEPSRRLTQAIKRSALLEAPRPYEANNLVFCR